MEKNNRGRRGSGTEKEMREGRRERRGKKKEKVRKRQRRKEKAVDPSQITKHGGSFLILIWLMKILGVRLRKHR